MRKLAVVTGAAIALAGTWTALAGPSSNLDTRPQANAYISVDFGHPQPSKALRAPLHYGLRMSYDNRLRADNGGDLPPLAAFDFDNRGNRIASFGGVPFAGRLVPLRQNEDGSVGGGEGSGLTFFDLGLMIAGAAGVGYLIFEVARNDESPRVDTGTTTGSSGGLLGGGSGGLLGGLLGGATGGSTGGLLGGNSGGLLGGASGGLLGGLAGGATGGATGYAGTGDRIAADRDVERLNWLDGGTGQMGDLQAAPKR